MIDTFSYTHTEWHTLLKLSWKYYQEILVVDGRVHLNQKEFHDIVVALPKLIRKSGQLANVYSMVLCADVYQGSCFYGGRGGHCCGGPSCCGPPKSRH